MYSEDYLYDQRQYRIGLNKIKNYFLGEINKNSLIIDIDDLLSILKNRDENFYFKCKDLILDIDICIYYINEGHLSDPALINQDKIRADKSIKNLKLLIESKIDKNLSDEDVEYKY